jgi:LacI family transcriptional regulator
VIENGPTALVCGNDRMAIGALLALHDLGLECPRDVSIVGFDDIPMTGWESFQLTTVRQATEDIGRLAAKRLLARIAREDTGPPQLDVFPTSLVRRRSTGPAANVDVEAPRVAASG